MKRLALALFLVACKADVHHTPDGGPLPATPDSLAPSSGDAPADAVKLKVTRAGVAVANVAVFFQAADSAPIAQSLTNDMGIAWAVMPSGGFVTALDHDELTTFSAVQAADALELELGPAAASGTSTFTLSLPTSASAAVYKVYSPCGTQTIDTPTADVTLVGCSSPTDLVVLPLDVDGNPVGTALFASSVDIKGSVDLSASSYEALAANQYALTNVPDTVTYVSLYGAISAERRAFESNSGAGVVGNSAMVDMQMPSSATTELTVATEFPTSGEIGRETFFNWHAPTTTFNLDVATAQLKRYASAPAFADHKLTWTERSAGRDADFVRAKVHFYRDGFPEGRAWHWRIAAPRTGTTIKFPTLPVVDFDYNFMTSDVVGVDELETVALPYPRTNPFVELTRAIAGTSGQIVVQSLYFESL